MVPPGQIFGLIANFSAEVLKRGTPKDKPTFMNLSPCLTGRKTAVPSILLFEGVSASSCAKIGIKKTLIIKKQEINLFTFYSPLT